MAIQIALDKKKAFYWGNTDSVGRFTNGHDNFHEWQYLKPGFNISAL